MKRNSYLVSGLLGMGVTAILVSCQTTGDKPETRPVGEPLVSKSELKRSQEDLRFVDHVKPILEGRCLYCHDGKEMPGKFSLATKEEAFAGGRIVPGEAEKSLLYVALTSGNHATAMPAVGMAPPPEEIDVLRRWINAGAVWPEGMTLKASDL